MSTIKLHNFSRSTTFVLVVSPSKILKYHHTLPYDYGTCGLGVNFYENLVNQIEGHYNDFKQKCCELKVIDFIVKYNSGIIFDFISNYMKNL